MFFNILSLVPVTPLQPYSPTLEGISVSLQGQPYKGILRWLGGEVRLDVPRTHPLSLVAKITLMTKGCAGDYLFSLGKLVIVFTARDRYNERDFKRCPWCFILYMGKIHSLIWSIFLGFTGQKQNTTDELLTLNQRSLLFAFLKERSFWFDCFCNPKGGFHSFSWSNGGP